MIWTARYPKDAVHSLSYPQYLRSVGQISVELVDDSLATISVVVRDIETVMHAFAVIVGRRSALP